jgi:hypothetical protein
MNYLTLAIPHKNGMQAFMRKQYKALLVLASESMGCATQSLY